MYTVADVAIDRIIHEDIFEESRKESSQVNLVLCPIKRIEPTLNLKIPERQSSPEILRIAAEAASCPPKNNFIRLLQLTVS